MTRPSVDGSLFGNFRHFVYIALPGPAIDNNHIFLKAQGLSNNSAILIHDQAAPVKKQGVLTADLITVKKRNRMAAADLFKNTLSDLFFIALKWRGGNIDYCLY